MKILVIPTIREESIKEFLETWDLCQWDKIIIIEDNPEKTFDLKIDCDYEHVSWKEIKTDLGKDAWVISRRDSAIRCYGFLKAFQENADYIFTLDDDCFPTMYDHCKEHIKNMEQHPKWIESVPNVRTRGLPYRNLGLLENVVMSMGFWTGIPDFDCVHSLASEVPKDFEPLNYTRIIPIGQYTPICGMNLAVKKEVACLCYYPLMGLDSPYKRFDDIWFGIIAKKICDHLGLYISCGTPFVEHRKQSDPFINLQKETPGIIFNEKFWTIVEEVNFKAKTPKGCMKEIAKIFQKSDNDYVSHLGQAIEIWEGFF